MKKFFENHQIEETVGTVVSNQNNKYTSTYDYTTPEVIYKDERGYVVKREPSETHWGAKTTYNNKFTIKTTNDNFFSYDVDGYDLSFKTDDPVRILTAIFKKRKIIFAVIDSNKNEIQFNTFHFRRKLKQRLYLYNFILLSVLTAFCVFLQKNHFVLQDYIRDFHLEGFLNFYLDLQEHLVFFYLLSFIVIIIVVRILLELYIFRIKKIYTPKGFKEEIINDCEHYFKYRIRTIGLLFVILVASFLFIDDWFKNSIDYINYIWGLMWAFIICFVTFYDPDESRTRSSVTKNYL